MHRGEGGLGNFVPFRERKVYGLFLAHLKGSVIEGGLSFPGVGIALDSRFGGFEGYCGRGVIEPDAPFTH